MPEITYIPVMAAVGGALPTPPIIKATTGQIDLYVDPSGDDNAAGDALNPIQTLLEVDKRIPFVVNHPVIVHLSSGVHLAPNRGYWLSSRILGSYIRITADESFDANVYAQVATGVAEVGTTNVFVAFTGVANAWKNKTIEFTSGAAAGHRRDVMLHSSSGMTPSYIWEPGFEPVSGDTFRIFDAGGCEIRLPLNGPPTSYGGTNRYQLIRRMHSSVADPTGANVQDQNNGSVVLDGMTFGSADVNSWSGATVNGDKIILMGTRTEPTIGLYGIYVEGGALIMGVAGTGFGIPGGIDDYVKWRGWGHRPSYRPPSPLAIWTPTESPVIDGYLNCSNAAAATIVSADFSRSRYRGGSIGRIPSGPGVNGVIDCVYEGSGSPRIQADTNPSVFANVTNPNSVLRLSGIDITMGGAILVNGGGRSLVIYGSETSIKRPVPGQRVIEVLNGGQVELFGSPVECTASTAGTPVFDWRIDGVDIDPIAEFASAGAVYFGANGSRIYRVS